MTLEEIMDSWFVAKNLRTDRYFIAHSDTAQQVGNTPTFGTRPEAADWLNRLRAETTNRRQLTQGGT